MNVQQILKYMFGSLPVMPFTSLQKRFVPYTQDTEVISKNAENITTGYQGSPGATRGHQGLPGVTRGYQGLLRVTRG